MRSVGLTPVVLAVALGVSLGAAAFLVRSMVVRPSAPPPAVPTATPLAQARPQELMPVFEGTPVPTAVTGPAPMATATEAAPAQELAPAPGTPAAAATPVPTREDARQPSIAATPTPLEQADAASLSGRITDVMARVVPRGSAAFIGPGGRVVAGYQAAQPRVAASTIKLPLVLETLRQAAQGRLDLAETYTVRSQDVVGGTGVLQGQVGRTLSYRELTRLTVVYSDNVAANVLLERVGMDNVNATTRALGFGGTHFERRLLDTAAQARGLENWITAEDLAGMLERLSEHSLLSADISEQVLALLRERGESDPNWLARGLPQGATLWHINGTLDRVRNDAGVIHFGADQSRSYVLVVCQDGLGDAAAGERAIAELARQVHALVAAASGVG